MKLIVCVCESVCDVHGHAAMKFQDISLRESL